MEISDIPLELTDKIFKIKFNPEHFVEKVTSYFPLSEQATFSNFNSIFSDTVTDEEWNKTKEQIKKRFQNELFDIDDET